MSNEVVSLLIAIFGIAGTLLSAVVTQSYAGRSRREEALAQAEVRRAEIDHVRDQDRFLQKQSAYTAVNAATRQFVVTLTDFLYRLKEQSSASSEDIASLDAAKNDHRNRYSELQLIAPGETLSAASRANQSLSSAYGEVRAAQRELATAPERALDSVEALLARRAVLWDAVREQRTAFRRELGVGD